MSNSTFKKVLMLSKTSFDNNLCIVIQFSFYIIVILHLVLQKIELTSGNLINKVQICLYKCTYVCTCILSPPKLLNVQTTHHLGVGVIKEFLTLS